MPKFINKNTIQLDKKLNELDLFVLDFVKVLEKHTVYVIVSGYTSLLFGRSRATEDVDILVPETSLEVFTALFKDLQNHDFWCLNADDVNTLYGDYLKQKTAVRFAKKNKIIPNMEFKFVKNNFDVNTIKNRVKIITKKGILFIGNLEEEIAFKEVVLCSDKDNEDARFLRNLFKDSLDMKLIENTKKLLQNVG